MHLVTRDHGINDESCVLYQKRYASRMCVRHNEEMFVMHPSPPAIACKV